MDKYDALMIRKNTIFSGIRTYYEDPVFVVKGENQYLVDDNGNKYLDFYAGVATAGLGYGNIHCIERAQVQLKNAQHISTLYISEPMLELAKKLQDISKSENYKVMFCNSGAEGIEFLGLLARLNTRDGYLISLDSGFHGMSLLANCLTGLEAWKHHPKHLNETVHVDTPYCYRCKYGLDSKSCNCECAKSIEKAILANGEDRFAAFIMESILGVGGVIVPPQKYFDEAVRIVKKYNGLLIMDEVQTGIGRTGKWFGFEHFGLKPDAFCLGKALGNGLPIGAVIASKELAELTSNVLVYVTFGSNPVSCAHSIAALEEIEKNNLLQHTETMGKYLFSCLKDLYDYDCIGDIRGRGLMAGIEIVKDKKTKEPDCLSIGKILNKLKNKFIMVGSGGLHKNVIRLAPPLIINKEDIDCFMVSIKEVLKELGHNA